MKRVLFFHLPFLPLKPSSMKTPNIPLHSPLQPLQHPRRCIQLPHTKVARVQTPRQYSDTNANPLFPAPKPLSPILTPDPQSENTPIPIPIPTLRITFSRIHTSIPSAPFHTTTIRKQRIARQTRPKIKLASTRAGAERGSAHPSPAPSSKKTPPKKIKNRNSTSIGRGRDGMWDRRKGDRWRSGREGGERKKGGGGKAEKKRGGGHLPCGGAAEIVLAARAAVVETASLPGAVTEVFAGPVAVLAAGATVCGGGSCG